MKQLEEIKEKDAELRRHWEFIIQYLDEEFVEQGALQWFWSFTFEL